MCYGANRDRIRSPVARTREAVRVCPGVHLPVLRMRADRRSVFRARLQGYGRSLLARVRSHHRASVLAQRRINGLGLAGEYQGLAVFSAISVLWGIGWFIHLDSNGLEIYHLWRSVSVWIGVRGSVPDFQYWDHWNGFGQLTATGRTGSGRTGGELMGWYQQFLALAKEYPNYGATILGVAGMFFTAFFGWLLKRPMTKQAVKTDQFNATIKGLQALNESQAETITYLEGLQRAHDQDRDHWYRTRAQLTSQIEDLESRLRPWPDTPTDAAVVIVVEDDNSSARVVLRILQRLGVEGFVTTRGYDALRHLRSGQFKLMVLDFGLPDISGIDVAILARREGINIPIIGLTGVAGDLPSDSPRMVEARFTAVLAKTSRADEIMVAIRSALTSGEAGSGSTG